MNKRILALILMGAMVAPLSAVTEFANEEAQTVAKEAAQKAIDDYKGKKEDSNEDFVALTAALKDAADGTIKKIVVEPGFMKKWFVDAPKAKAEAGYNFAKTHKIDTGVATVAVSADIAIVVDMIKNKTAGVYWNLIKDAIPAVLNSNDGINRKAFVKEWKRAILLGTAILSNGYTVVKNGGGYVLAKVRTDSPTPPTAS